MSQTTLILFVAASLALIVVPGPDMIYVATRGIARGRRAGLISTAGVCSGVCVHTVLAAVGLSAILANSAAAFSVVKYAGAAYLIYLGIRSFLDKESFAVPDAAPEHNPPTKAWTLFRQGAISDLLNPKIALFFLAFLPQFAGPASENVGLRLLALGLTFTLLTFLIFGAVAFFSGSLGSWLRSSPRFAAALRWLTSSVLVGLGLLLALPDNR